MDSTRAMLKSIFHACFHIPPLLPVGTSVVAIPTPSSSPFESRSPAGGTISVVFCAVLNIRSGVRELKYFFSRGKLGLSLVCVSNTLYAYVDGPNRTS